MTPKVVLSVAMSASTLINLKTNIEVEAWGKRDNQNTVLH